MNLRQAYEKEDVEALGRALDAPPRFPARGTSPPSRWRRRRASATYGRCGIGSCRARPPATRPAALGQAQWLRIAFTSSSLSILLRPEIPICLARL